MQVNGLEGFVANACKSYPNEVAGFLFSKNLYSPSEEWLVLPVKNVSPTPDHAWQPDKNEMLSAKKQATKQGYIKIGNIHSHPYQHEKEHDSDSVENQVQPSDVDLSFARKFNDIVRIIVLVKPDAILASFVHDKFGNEIKVMLHDHAD